MREKLLFLLLVFSPLFYTAFYAKKRVAEQKEFIEKLNHRFLKK